MFGCSVNRYHTNYQMNECEYTRSNQLDILYAQSRLSSVGVWYNLPGEGTPKELQSRVNIGFTETGKSTLLNVNDLVQENGEDGTHGLLKSCRSASDSLWQGVASRALSSQMTHIYQRRCLAAIYRVPAISQHPYSAQERSPRAWRLYSSSRLNTRL